MPAPQLHLSFALGVADVEGVPARLRAACRQEPTYTRLGGIFHDLPYYNNMLLETVRYGFGKPALDEPWAYRMHSVTPAKLVASYIRAARTTPGLGDAERLALVGGLLSHCALDLSMHPLVNYCARRDTDALGGFESMNHRLTEKYHALFFHVEKRGQDPIGSPEFRAWTRVVKHGSLRRATCEPTILAFMSDAFSGAYGGAPAAARWAGWVRSFAHFGILVGTQLAARNSAKRARDEGLRRRFYDNEAFHFMDFYAAAERRLALVTQLGCDYFDAGEFDAASEARFVAASTIDDLAEPMPVGLPELPALSVRHTPGLSAPYVAGDWRSPTQPETATAAA